MNRTKHSMRNSIWGIIYRVLHMVFPVIFRAIIIREIGAAYVGLNGLFKSILEVLNLTELGFGSAVTYMMYKPIAIGDKKMINRLLVLLRRVYRIIGLVVLCAGVAIIPFLDILVKNDTGADVNIYLLYGMYLLHTVLSYWMSAYRSTLFTAHQEQEVIYKIGVVCTIVQYAFQIVALYVTKNYYIYLSIFAIMIIPENLLYQYVSKKKYPDLRCEGNPTEEEKGTIRIKIGSLLGHRIGNTVIFSIDSMVISAFIGLSILTKYDNYNYILTAIVSLMTILMTSVLASVGDKLTTDSLDDIYSLFEMLSFLWIGLIAWCSTCLMSLYQPFITIWVGSDYLFPIEVVICIALYFYVWQFRQIGLVFKDAAGLWERDRLKPYIGMITNIISSILFVKITGSILGVLIPTMVILVFIYFPWETRVLFQNLFKKSAKDYIRLLLRFIGSSLVAAFFTFFVSCCIQIQGVIGIVVKGCACVIIMPTVYILLNFNTDQFKRSMELMYRLLKKYKNER